MKKIQITMNKPVYLGLSILDLSQIVLYDFWYDYIKPKYDERAKLSYTDTHSFIGHIKKKISTNILQKKLNQDLRI